MNIFGEKIGLESRVLNRKVHLDVFPFSEKPQAVVLLFGGSGIDEDEYWLRGETLTPVFDELFSKLPKLNMTLVHLTAPFDIPYARFEDFPEARKKWNSHVMQELLEPWCELPFLVSSFSGGACLAFNGIEKDKRCIGGAAMGLDSLPRNFSTPPHWPEKLEIYSAPNDPVCNAASNRAVIERLVDAGQAVESPLPRGRHQLSDYSTELGLGRFLLGLSNSRNLS